MSGDGEKLLRVRGGPRGFRMITLGQWKDEISARRGIIPPKAESRQKQRMDMKQKRRNKAKAKRRQKP